MAAMSGGYNAEGYSRQAAVNQLYQYNQSESTEVGGQGRYVNWNDLPSHFRNMAEEQDNIFNAGFDYGRHEDSMRDGGGSP